MCFEIYYSACIIWRVIYFFKKKQELIYAKPYYKFNKKVFYYKFSFNQLKLANKSLLGIAFEIISRYNI